MIYRTRVCESERNEICRKTDFQLYLSQKRVKKKQKGMKIWQWLPKWNGKQHRISDKIIAMQHCEIGKNIHINIINIGHILGVSVKGRGKCWFDVLFLVWVHYIQCSELMRIYWKKAETHNLRNENTNSDSYQYSRVSFSIFRLYSKWKN